MINIITFWHYRTLGLEFNDWSSAFKLVDQNTAVIPTLKHGDIMLEVILVKKKCGDSA